MSGNDCVECSKTFSKKSNLNRHMKMVHQKESSSYGKNEKSFQCLEGCEISFRCNRDLIRHLTDEHDFKFATEELSFSSVEEFNAFLNKIHELEDVEYSLQTGKRTKKKSTTSEEIEISRFYCSRSGNHRKQSVVQKRRTKLIGSKKINRSCTSQIKLVIDKTRKNVSATYFKTHYGHKIDLKHITIPKVEKATIAHKLSIGVPITRILDDQRQHFDADKINRMNLLNRKDIHNVKTSFNIEINQGVRHNEDAVSVEMYVRECQNADFNPIAYYKAQGMEQKDCLETDDFCMILMNKSQEQMLEKFGKNIIAIDSTHGLNPYDFELTTLLVIDEWGEGFPGACMVTNRKDTCIFQLFFQVIREKVGALRAKVFMSDVTNVFYNAWVLVMGEVISQLYCAWHIDRAWQSNLNKISNVDMKKSAYHTLKILQTTTCREEFHILLTKAVDQLLEDDATKSFGTYFQNNYSLNYKLWAYCYRQNCGINTNMRLESMHKVLKYLYLDAKKVKRLDKGLHALNRFIRDKIVERIIKNVKGKNSSHLRNINNRHSTAVQYKCRIEIAEQGTSNSLTWSVISLSKESNNYMVTKFLDINCNCQLICYECNICIHSYSCNCPDYFIHNTICKHIHYVVIKTKNQSNTTQEKQLNLTDLMEEVPQHLQTLSHDSSDRTSLLKTISYELHKLTNNISEVTDTAALKHVSKTLRNENTLIESKNSNIPEFSIRGNHNKISDMSKNISKQLRFYSTKKKRSNKNNRISKPTIEEIETIKGSLTKTSALFVSSDPLLDHNYC